MGSINFEGGLCSPIQDQTSTGKRPPDNQRLCRSPERTLPKGVCTESSAQEGHRDGEGSDISSLLQQTFHSPKTTKPNQKWRPVLDLSALNKFLSIKTFKMEKPQKQSGFLSIRENGLPSWISVTPIFTSPFTPGRRNTSGSTSKIGPSSSGPSLLASQQLQWSSLG